MSIDKLGAVALVAILAIPGISLAETTSVAQLQTELQALIVQVQQLQAQLATAQGGSSTWCYTFNTNLSIGMQGPDVIALQNALLKDGESVTVNGSFGNETALAVIAFQERFASDVLKPNGLIHGTGYVGTATRGKLNALFGCVGPAAEIYSLSPASGPAGTQVTITGNGFASTAGNTIEMNGMVDVDRAMTNVISPDGKTLTFTVPESLRDYCIMVPGYACPGVYVVSPVSQGTTYQITVVANYVPSNSQPFTVFGSSTAPPAGQY